VIDTDGHTLELAPVFIDYLREEAGSEVVARYARHGAGFRGLGMTPEERSATRTMKPPWWAAPARNTLDRATASLPRLLSERLDDIGIDFTILYPSLGMSFICRDALPDEELRRAGCRAFNRFQADTFAPHAARMTPAALIPMHTPEEAIDELDHAVGELGLKVVALAGHVLRPVPSVTRDFPGFPWPGTAEYLDTFGIDSDHDYDPVWRRCLELGVAPTFHSPGQGWGSRRSVSSYVYNHIGHFAAAAEALCKSLFLGGVTRRFPQLRFAFLECGTGWACSLYSDLVGHWRKRNREALRDLDPSSLDLDQMTRLVEAHAEGRARGRSSELREFFARGQPAPDPFDEWAACEIEKASDVRDLFVPSFFFGCEADDPLTALAFDERLNPFGARLSAMMSSDLGHWDVPDMTRVLEEAYELVERELLSERDFHDFTFANAVRLHAASNPHFFDGTAVEGAARAQLGLAGDSGCEN
jgi:predicted TIM-barrel fold metal-dependent hydrolase